MLFQGSQGWIFSSHKVFPGFCHFSMIFITFSKFHDISRFSRCTLIFPGFPGRVGTLDTYNSNMAREVVSQRQPKDKCPEFRAYGEDRFQDAQSQVPIPHCSVLEVYKSIKTDIPWEDDIIRDLGATYWKNSWTSGGKEMQRQTGTICLFKNKNKANIQIN